MALLERVKFSKAIRRCYTVRDRRVHGELRQQKPQANSAHQLSYATGSYNFNRLVADSTGR